LEKKEKERKF